MANANNQNEAYFFTNSYLFQIVPIITEIKPRNNTIIIETSNCVLSCVIEITGFR